MFALYILQLHPVRKSDAESHTIADTPLPPTTVHAFMCITGSFQRFLPRRLVPKQNAYLVQTFCAVYFLHEKALLGGARIHEDDLICCEVKRLDHQGRRHIVLCTY